MTKLQILVTKLPIRLGVASTLNAIDEDMGLAWPHFIGEVLARARYPFLLLGDKEAWRKILKIRVSHDLQHNNGHPNHQAIVSRVLKRCSIYPVKISDIWIVGDTCMTKIEGHPADVVHLSIRRPSTIYKASFPPFKTSSLGLFNPLPPLQSLVVLTSNSYTKV